jgi:hypothetical protein
MSGEEQKQSVVTNAKFVGKFECPFDLNNVFEINFNQENLKGLLKWIVDHLGDLRVDMGELEKKVVSKLMQVDK